MLLGGVQQINGARSINLPLRPPNSLVGDSIYHETSLISPPSRTETSSSAQISEGSSSSGVPSRYEAQKRRDWNTFGQYLKNHRPPLALTKCSGAHVLEFLRYLDQFGKTKVHAMGCPYFGHPQPSGPCGCPLKQAWGSLDALIGRLRAAYEENGGKPESNPFGARAVRLYLREVRESQAKARGIAYEKKKRKRPPVQPQSYTNTCSTGQSGGAHFQSPSPPPPAPPSASSSGDQESIYSGTSSLLISSFN
ncbi:hypothetical protein KP509_14G090800 [Ceratopteris richardii]|nr:hypothetical protein KP509_14G090800 [Ceratopteris richardii]